MCVPDDPTLSEFKELLRGCVKGEEWVLRSFEEKNGRAAWKLARDRALIVYRSPLRPAHAIHGLTIDDAKLAIACAQKAYGRSDGLLEHAATMMAYWRVSA